MTLPVPQRFRPALAVAARPTSRRLRLSWTCTAGAVRRRVAGIRRGTGDRGASDDGMSTAEYAVGTIAAVAFAAVLYKVVSSPTVLSALTAIISRALKAPF